MIKKIIKHFLYKTGLRTVPVQKPDLAPLSWDRLFADTDLVCVDVGGANDLPPNWTKINKHGNFIVYEPDKRSYDALIAAQKQNFRYIPEGLSRDGGIRKFNLYNVPTGSTFYHFKETEEIREINSLANDYIHPIKEIEINTTSLDVSLTKEKIDRIDMIKLDVQGAELEILEGLDDYRWSCLLCCEAEVNFHEIYEGATTYGAINKKLIDSGFKLFDLRIARYYKIPSKESDRILKKYFSANNPLPSLSGKIWEADHVYMRDSFWALNKFSSIKELKRLAIIYCVYNFFVDAIDVCEKWVAKYPASKNEIDIILQSILALHQIELDNLNSVNNFLKSNNYQNWAQYEWVPYPSS